MNDEPEVNIPLEVFSVEQQPDGSLLIKGRLQVGEKVLAAAAITRSPAVSIFERNLEFLRPGGDAEREGILPMSLVTPLPVCAWCGHLRAIHDDSAAGAVCNLSLALARFHVRAWYGPLRRLTRGLRRKLKR